MSDIQELYDIGRPIFFEIFKLKDSDLKEKLKSILGEEDKYENLFSETSVVERKIKNDLPQDITISYYDSFSISPFGINFKREHGEGKTLVKFNKHFKL